MSNVIMAYLEVANYATFANRSLLIPDPLKTWEQLEIYVLRYNIRNLIQYEYEIIFAETKEKMKEEIRLR